MSAIEIFPVGLLDPAREDDVIAFIRALIIDPEDRKRLLLMWTIEVGAVLTREMVERIGAD